MLVNIFWHVSCNSEASLDDLIDEYGLEAMFDALYYACENGAEMLQDQTDYFTERLYEDEIGYYFHRMTGVEGYPALIAGTMNVSELARVCGLSRPTVYKYLNIIAH